MTAANKKDRLDRLPVKVDKFIADVANLRAEAIGAYWMILMHTWRQKCEPPPDDDEELSAIARVDLEHWKRSVRKKIEPKFDLSNRTWRNPKLEETWAEVQNLRQKTTTRAKHAADSRWGKDDAPGSTPRTAPSTPKRNAPSTSPDAPSTPQSSPSRNALPMPKENKKEERKKERESETEPTTSNNNHEVLTERTACELAGESSTVADVSPPKDEKKYKWQGDIIRLTPEDFDRWKNSFPNVQLTAELAALDPWLAKQPEEKRRDWFMIVASALAKKQKENARQGTAASDGDESAADYGRHASGRRRVGQG